MEPPPPLSESSSRTSQAKEYVSRHRYVLGLVAVLAVLSMGIGIVFVASKFYHDFGGQGFLGRGIDADEITTIKPSHPRDFRRVVELLT